MSISIRKMQECEIWGLIDDETEWDTLDEERGCRRRELLKVGIFKL